MCYDAIFRNDSVLIATTGIRYTIAAVYATVSVCGIIPDILLFYILLKLRTWKDSPGFSLISISILICDIIQLVSQLVVAFPLTLFGNNFYIGNIVTEQFYYFASLLDTIGFQGLVWFTFLMSLNRFTIFMLPKLHKLIFAGMGNITIIITSWIFTLATVYLYHFFERVKGFNTDGFYFYMMRLLETGSPKCPAVFVFDEVQRLKSYVLPFSTFAIYFVVFIQVRKELKGLSCTGRKNQTSTKEINLLIQGGIICLVLNIEIISFDYLPYLGTGGYAGYWINMLQNISSIINNSINPYVYYCFNTAIRNEFRRILRIAKSTTTPIEISTVTARRATRSRSDPGFIS